MTLLPALPHFSARPRRVAADLTLQSAKNARLRNRLLPPVLPLALYSESQCTYLQGSFILLQVSAPHPLYPTRRAAAPMRCSIFLPSSRLCRSRTLALLSSRTAHNHHAPAVTNLGLFEGGGAGKATKACMRAACPAGAGAALHAVLGRLPEAARHHTLLSARPGTPKQAERAAPPLAPSVSCSPAPRAHPLVSPVTT